MANDDEALAAALEEARSAPDDEDAWDKLEEVAADAQSPDEVAELFREVLERDLDPALTASLGQRAVNWLEEWFGEDAPLLVAILGRVLDVDPTQSWAFQRLTVVHTAAGRFSDLLALYDTTLAKTDDVEQKKLLLDEATNIAKDFAGDSSRAIDYMLQLLPLKPKDKQLVSSLERLLEKEERWEDLLALWSDRIASMRKKKDIQGMRARIARAYLERLGQPEAALEQTRLLIDAGGVGEESAGLLEAISTQDAASSEVRLEALAILKERYERQNRNTDIVRLLDSELALAGTGERVALHREAGERQVAQGDLAAALEHYSSLLKLDATARDAVEQLREISRQLGAHERFAQALIDAADATEDGAARVALRAEAADVKRTQLSDIEGAIELYRGVIEEPGAEGAVILSVARRLSDLFGVAERHSDRLAVLERLSRIEPEAADRKAAVGLAARTADQLGDPDRALATWRLRIEEDPHDLEALGASIEILQREERHAALVEMLRARATAPVPRLRRRADLVQVAKVQAEQLEEIPEAITTWSGIAEEYGEDSQTVDNLATLLTAAERHLDVAELLGRAADREADHVASIYSRIGDVQREQLASPRYAAEAYSSALRIDAGFDPARGGLTALLDDDECRAAAAEALYGAYAQTDEWQGQLTLLPHRLETAPNSIVRVRLLREAATLQEERAEDREAALGSMQQAMQLAPELRDIEAEVLRLAEATDRWDVAVSAIRGAIEALGPDSPRARYLRFWEGKLVEEHQDDPEAALEAYGIVFDGDPERREAAHAVVRTGARAGSWARVAGALIRASSVGRHLDEELAAGIEKATQEADAWGELAAATEKALGASENLDRKLARELEARLADWHQTHRSDLDAAEAALARAVLRDDGDEPTLRRWIELQRRHVDRELYDSLLKLAELADDDLDPLREACDVAAKLEDPALVRASVERLYRDATRIWKRGAKARGEQPADECARWALDQLAAIYESADESARSVALLADAAHLPVDAETSIELRRRAAATAASSGERQRAIVLYRSILDETPDDQASLGALADVCEAEGSLPEMLALRQHELTLATDPERRLDLRLDIVRIVGEMEARGGRIESLKQNLEEQPGHGASIAALVEVLENGRRYRELSETLTNQAAKLEAQGEARRAAGLWGKVAQLAEEHIKDVDRAVSAHRRVVELSATPQALDALARLHTDRGEHAAAAQWLDRRMSTAEPEERADIARKLAEAHLGAEQRDRAIAALEAAREDAPDRADLRDMLAEQYRAAGALEPLANLLTEAAPHVEDTEVLLAYAREAAEIYERIDAPDRAIDILEKAAQAAPKERDVRIQLAAGLRVAGRHDEAAEILGEVIKSYGRRRNAERAAVHLSLAKVLSAQGNDDSALAELETASKMDVSNPVILRLLGQLALEAGDPERGERAFRALLLIVRRAKADDPAAIGASEVQFELHRIAKVRGDEEQSEELLASAIESATADDVEAQRLVRTLLERGEPDLALRTLDTRLEKAEDDESQAKLQVEAARVLDQGLGKSGEATDRILAALSHAPGDDEIRSRARELARRAERSEELANKLDKLVKKADGDIAAKLGLSAGVVAEEDLSDLSRALKRYRAVEKLDLHVVEARQSIARVAAAAGKVDEERRALSALIDAPADTLSAAARIDALYRLAEVQLHSDDARDEGVELIVQALDRDPRYLEAGRVLMASTTATPDHAKMLAVYERVARGSGDADLLLDFLTKRAGRADATLGEVREAVEMATEQEKHDRAEALLTQAAEIARGTEDGLAGSLWIARGLAERRKAAGDIEGAVRWLTDAAESTTDEEQAYDLMLGAAGLAAGEDGDLEVAADAFARLYERDPNDQRVWEPYLGVLRRLGNEDRLTDLAVSLIDGLLDPALRNSVRMHRALFLLEREGREPDAADVLRSILDEEPDHVDAGRMLADLFEKTGYDEDLVDLLSRQLDFARDNQDKEQIKELSVRLGGILEKVRREDAIDVYRRGLDWLPEDRELAQALLAQLGDEADPREKIEVTERLLATETGAAAAELATSLAAQWEQLEEPDGVRRALELGYRGCPEDGSIRERLEAMYRERELWEPLAAYTVSEAERLADDPAHSVALLRYAAGIHRETLASPVKAAEVLSIARGRAPADMELLAELVTARAEAGQQDVAVEEVGATLEETPEESPARVDLLRMRAQLKSSVGEIGPALDDLETAFARAPESVGDDLVAALRQQREVLAEAGDAEQGRVVVLRLVEVLRAMGDGEEARFILSEWVDSYDDDREALLMLRDTDEAGERWDELVRTCERLVQLETGDSQVDAVLRLADAAEKAGRNEAARAGLEHVLSRQPEARLLRDRLRTLYEQIGAHRELGNLLMQDATATEDADARFMLLCSAGDHYLKAGDADAASAPLDQAVALRPDDHAVTILLVDTYIASERFADAGQKLEQAIANHTRRRSPELSQLQHRMARLASVAGDRDLQLQWLNAALDSDKSNGHVAAELARLAMDLHDHDVALNALRVVTLNKTEGPMSRAMAFLLQARIAHERGEARRALLWARKARSEDPELEEAQDFLRQIGDA